MVQFMPTRRYLRLVLLLSVVSVSISFTFDNRLSSGVYIKHHSAVVFDDYAYLQFIKPIPIHRIRALIRHSIVKRADRLPWHAGGIPGFLGLDVATRFIFGSATAFEVDVERRRISALIRTTDSIIKNYLETHDSLKEVNLESERSRNHTTTLANELLIVNEKLKNLTVFSVDTSKLVFELVSSLEDLHEYYTALLGCAEKKFSTYFVSRVDFQHQIKVLDDSLYDKGFVCALKDISQIYTLPLTECVVLHDNMRILVKYPVRKRKRNYNLKQLIPLKFKKIWDGSKQSLTCSLLDLPVNYVIESGDNYFPITKHNEQFCKPDDGLCQIFFLSHEVSPLDNCTRFLLNDGFSGNLTTFCNWGCTADSSLQMSYLNRSLVNLVNPKRLQMNCQSGKKQDLDLVDVPGSILISLDQCSCSLIVDGVEHIEPQFRCLQDMINITLENRIPVEFLPRDFHYTTSGEDSIHRLKDIAISKWNVTVRDKTFIIPPPAVHAENVSFFDQFDSILDNFGFRLLTLIAIVLLFAKMIHQYIKT